MPDPVFFNVVQTVINDAGAHPEKFHTPPTSEQVDTMAQAVLDMQSNPQGGGAEAFSNAIFGEVRRYIGTILNSISTGYQERHQEVIIS